MKWIAIPFPRGIFPTQESNPGLPHCRQILYCLSRQGSPFPTWLGSKPYDHTSCFFQEYRGDGYLFCGGGSSEILIKQSCDDTDEDTGPGRRRDSPEVGQRVGGGGGRGPSAAASVVSVPSTILSCSLQLSSLENSHAVTRLLHYPQLFGNPYPHFPLTFFR